MYVVIICITTLAAQPSVLISSGLVCGGTQPICFKSSAKGGQCGTEINSWQAEAVTLAHVS